MMTDATTNIDIDRIITDMIAVGMLTIATITVTTTKRDTVEIGESGLILGPLIITFIRNDIKIGRASCRERV